MPETYRLIAETETDSEAPITADLMKALQKNWIAGFEGAVGAPRLVGRAVAYDFNEELPVVTVAAGTIRSHQGCRWVPGPFNGIPATPANTWLLVGTYTVVSYTGSLRFACDTSALTGTSVTGRYRVLLNGVVVNTFVKGVLTTQRYTQDISVSPGDVITWEVYMQTGTNGSATAGPTADAEGSYHERTELVYADNPYRIQPAYRLYNEAPS